MGGIPRSRVFTKCFMALLGQWPWHRVVPIPPEMILLPPSAPFSIYNFACWARQTVVPLSVVWALRPVRAANVELREIGARPGQSKPAGRPSPLRRRALAAAERWVKDRQEADGSWGGIQPPWVWSIVMLAALGRGFEDETLRRAVEGWGAFMVEDGERLRPEACQSPVWDTALAVLALRAAGIPADHPQLRKAGEWLLAEEVTVKGDWAIRRPDLAPGGWAFEFENDLYPDVDDAAVVALALRELGLGEDAVRRGLDWVEGMQSANGGWGAFDADNSSYWLYKLPFCDFGYVIDPPSEDVSAHALEALAPDARYGEAVARGLEYLVREQQWDGSWWGRWGVNHVYGTGAVLPALEACGFERAHPVMRKGVEWLDSVQNGRGITRLRRCRRIAESVGQKSGRLSFGGATGERRLERGALHRDGFPNRFHDPLPPVPAPLPPDGPRSSTRKAQRMKFPLRSTVQIGKYVATQRRKGELYPLVLMLEPTLACNLACIGCGKIREYESNKARLSVDECIDAGAQCPAPVVSICGGEPLIYKGIEDVVAGMLELGKNIDLCTNALKLTEFLDVFKPDPRLTFVVHLDGMREIHDYVCDYPGLWEVAVDAIKQARTAGFRVTTNTTIFKETAVGDVIEMMGYLTDDVGIDGMLIAPGYQYSQIDPALTMTRDEHEAKFRAIRTAVRKQGYRWLASPIYQDFLTGDRKLACAPWGSITRNPYGWKGPCYLLTDGIFPTYDALLDNIEWEAYGPGNDPRCEHCGIHSGFEPSAAYEATSSVKETVRSMAWTLTG